MSINEEDIIYPTVDDIYKIHNLFIAKDPKSESRIQNRGNIDFALTFIKHGYFGKKPETLHEKAANLMRLLASNREFTDGNKRTAVATTVSFYYANEYYLDYDEDKLKNIVKKFAIDESKVDMDKLINYFRQVSIPLDQIEDFSIVRSLKDILEL